MHGWLYRWQEKTAVCRNAGTGQTNFEYHCPFFTSVTQSTTRWKRTHSYDSTNGSQAGHFECLPVESISRKLTKLYCLLAHAQLARKQSQCIHNFSLHFEIDILNKQSITRALQRMSIRDLLSNQCITKESLTIGKGYNRKIATPPRFVFFVNLAICQLHNRMLLPYFSARLAAS